MKPGTRLSGGLIALYLLALPAAAQTSPPAQPIKLQLIAPGTYAAISGNSNAGFIIGDDGVLVVDAFFEPNTARALLKEIRNITSKPIRYLVNTHYHIDHVAGDQVFKDVGATILAHRNVSAWMRSENLLSVGEKADPELRARIVQLPFPDGGIDGPVTLRLGARSVNIRPVEGHTGGDLVVSVPDARVLFCGDMLWNVPPNIDDGTVSKWIVTLRGFEQLPDAASMIFVPGHGDVSAVKDVTTIRIYLTDLQSLTAAGLKAGLKGEALAADVIPKLQASHHELPTPPRPLAREVMFMEQELVGTKRVPQAAR